MLELVNIIKEYQSGDTTVQALKGISLSFREHEFVSILGPSGCGKTTFLNIIGGLDRYTSGDLKINNISTKKYKDADWDSYRNNSIGFVFQNYNLIPHQTVLSNVELALTLSGVSKEERRARAKNVLEQVGLGDQLHKKPNQMSGGQMQRVAIARALVNDPDIILADEPTGALDSATSVQIMDVLREISKNKLIIMVTHNAEIAEQYSSRIVRLRDGEVMSDSNPYTPTDTEKVAASSKKKAKGTSMNFLTALSLSMNNLMTKKGRTLLTAFAGSIGIIGIALILALSHGIQSYISRVEEETLSSYPITVEEQTVDISGMIGTLMETQTNTENEGEAGKIYSKNIISEMMNSMSAKMEKNNLKAFKTYIESADFPAKESVNAVQYSYNLNLNLYKQLENNEYIQVNPSQVVTSMGMGKMLEAREASPIGNMNMMEQFNSTDVWEELLDNQKLLATQYDVLAGHMPEAYNQVVLVVNKDNTISDYTLLSLGLESQDKLAEDFKKIQNGEAVEKAESKTYTYDELMELSFKLVLNTDYYAKENGVWLDKSNNADYMQGVMNDAAEIEVVGILRPNEESIATGMSTGFIGYTKELKEYVINHVNEATIVQEQKADTAVNVFTGTPFPVTTSAATVGSGFDYSSLSDEQKMAMAMLSDEEIANLMATYSANANATYEGNLEKLGSVDLETPSSINIYPVNFDAKEQITSAITAYNDAKTAEGNEGDVINYTDLVGVMMNSVTSIINVVSYVLIAFVGISLVVSSIMIGIITYISVLERTKEIGILRSIGASKKDISRVFNAETFIVGLIAGVLGIGITVLLTIPANIIIKNLVNISGIAKLPVSGGVILIIISMLLTVIPGLIPARIASKKDPVIALRTE